MLKRKKIEKSMRIALYEPDIPQNIGNILRLSACLGIEVDIIGPPGFVFDNKKFNRASMDYLDLAKYKKHLDWDSFYKWSNENQYRLICCILSLVNHHKI